MESDVLIQQGHLTVEWQAPQETTVPDKQERARQIQVWMREYNIPVGDYKSVGSVTVTVAGVTFCEDVNTFPSVALYVNIALAVNTGNLKKQEGLTYDNLVRMHKSMNRYGYAK